MKEQSNNKKRSVMGDVTAICKGVKKQRGYQDRMVDRKKDK
jgi:hypothetical protein